VKKKEEEEIAPVVCKRIKGMTFEGLSINSSQM